MNVHPGLLPEYRGCSCVEWAIFNDDPIGNTVHFMDLDYDTGPIIDRRAYQFCKENNYVDIRTKVYLDGGKLASKALTGIESEEITIEKCIKQEQKNGKFWEPIPCELELKAIKKANQRKYKYQKQIDYNN